MAETNTMARALHDTGLAGWFGGSLMGAVGVNGAASEVSDPSERARVANAGWGRWTPVNLVAIATHLVGSVMLIGANKGRLTAQRGVASSSAVKAALTVGALGATAYSRALGQKVMNAGDVPVEGGTSPNAFTPPEVADAQKKLALMQWLIPAMTGSALVMNAYMGEQQRPKEVASDILGRLFGG